MKSLRHNKILELIKEYPFDTQEDLQNKLGECGFNVTQATVSRDIRELGLIKSEGSDGVYKYRQSKEKERIETNNGKFPLILKQAISKVSCANNLIVLKTFAGMGSAAGAAFDAMEIEGVIGTLAGDDTLLIIAADNDSAAKVTAIIHDLID